MKLYVYESSKMVITKDTNTGTFTIKLWERERRTHNVVGVFTDEEIIAKGKELFKDISGVDYWLDAEYENTESNNKNSLDVEVGE